MKVTYKERFEKYLVVFNELKFKYTGIKSRCSPNNRKTIKAWNNAVEGLDKSGLDDLARDIVKAIYAATHSDWHKQSKYKWITPELFLRQDKLEYWTNEYIANHHRGDLNKRTHNINLNNVIKWD